MKQQQTYHWLGGGGRGGLFAAEGLLFDVTFQKLEKVLKKLLMDPQSHLCQLQRYSLVSIPVCADSHSSLPYRIKVAVLGKNPVHVPFHWSLHLE